MKINRVKSLNGEITIPGDKSISHRSIMFGSIADGITEVHGFLNGADCISSMKCFRQMGIDIYYDGSVVTVHGKGLNGLQPQPGRALLNAHSMSATAEQPPDLYRAYLPLSHLQADS